MPTEQDTLTVRANLLYDQYARPLEREHAGKFIAISPNGEFVLGEKLEGTLDEV